MVNQSKLKSYRDIPSYKFRFQVPRNNKEAMELYKENGNTHWGDTEVMELSQIDEYSVLKDLGEYGKSPEGFKSIKVHLSMILNVMEGMMIDW